MGFRRGARYCSETSNGEKDREITPMDFIHATEFHEVVLRLGAAAGCGAVLGINRDLHQKPAGLRVLAMVSLGSAFVTLSSITATAHDASTAPDGVTRTVQGILAGIGFLGGGVILRGQGHEVYGITTAASIWVAAGLGITCGLGQWSIAATALVIAMLILTLGLRLEKIVLRWVKHSGVEEDPNTQP